MKKFGAFVRRAQLLCLLSLPVLTVGCLGIDDKSAESTLGEHELGKNSDCDGLRGEERKQCRKESRKDKRGDKDRGDKAIDSTDNSGTGGDCDGLRGEERKQCRKESRKDKRGDKDRDGKANDSTDDSGKGGKRAASEGKDKQVRIAEDCDQRNLTEQQKEGARRGHILTKKGVKKSIEYLKAMTNGGDRKHFERVFGEYTETKFEFIYKTMKTIESKLDNYVIHCADDTWWNANGGIGSPHGEGIEVAEQFFTDKDDEVRACTTVHELCHQWGGCWPHKPDEPPEKNAYKREQFVSLVNGWDYWKDDEL